MGGTWAARRTEEDTWRGSRREIAGWLALVWSKWLRREALRERERSRMGCIRDGDGGETARGGLLEPYYREIKGSNSSWDDFY